MEMDKKLVRGISRPIGMTAGYALQLLHCSRERDRPEVDWLTLKDGSHPTVKEAIEWLRTLDYNFDIVNGVEGDAK